VPYWARMALGGMPGPIDKSIYAAGKGISGTMLDLITDPAKLKKCWDEFNERTKDGIVGPLLPPDMEPPIDLRWPEYITTPRGREWWIPPIKKG